MKIVIPFLVAVVLAVSCQPQESDTPAQIKEELAVQAREDSLAVVASLQTAKTDSMESRYPEIRYVRTVIDSRQTLDSIRRTFKKTTENWDAYRALTTLNRKDLQFFRLGDTVVLPETIVEDLTAYSLFPQYYAEARDIEKIIIVSAAYQSYACYENGELVRFAATNTGEEGKPTLPGRYAVNWKQLKRLSSLDSTWVMPYTVNFHLFAGSAMHQFEMPGRPVSHSCMRQFMSDAKWIYSWIDQGNVDQAKRVIIPYTGTPLIILDVFDFSRKKGGPWLDLTSSRDRKIELPDDPMNVEEALIPISQIPHTVRHGLPNKERYVTAEKVLRERGTIRENAHLKESIDHNKRRREKKRAQERKRNADSVAAAKAALEVPVAPPEPTPTDVDPSE